MLFRSVANPIIGPGPDAVNRASQLHGAAAPVFKPEEVITTLDRGLARSELQLHGFRFARAVYQMPLDYSAEMHLQAGVMHIPFDPRTRLHFEEPAHVTRHRDHPV